MLLVVSLPTAVTALPTPFLTGVNAVLPDAGSLLISGQGGACPHVRYEERDAEIRQSRDHSIVISYAST